MSETSNKNTHTIHVTVDAAGKASANPPCAQCPDGNWKLTYKLDTAGWVFGTVTIAPPFSGHVKESDTKFTVNNNANQFGSFSFSVVLQSTSDAPNAPQTDADLDPEVLNGPHG